MITLFIILIALFSFGTLISAFSFLVFLFEKKKDEFLIIISMIVCFFSAFISFILIDYTKLKYNAQEKIRMAHFENLVAGKADENLIECIRNNFYSLEFYCDMNISAVSLDDKPKRDKILNELKKSGFNAEFTTKEFCTNTGLRSPKGKVRECNTLNVLKIN